MNLRAHKTGQKMLFHGREYLVLHTIRFSVLDYLNVLKPTPVNNKLQTNNYNNHGVRKLVVQREIGKHKSHKKTKLEFFTN